METAREIKKRAAEAGVELILPTDHQVVDSYDPLKSRKTIPIEVTNAGLVASTSVSRPSRCLQMP